jgi:Ca2+/Na+ antiporter
MPFGNDGRGTLWLAVLAAATLFASSRAAAGALTRGGTLGAARPGQRAVGFWLPIAITCFVALRLGRAEVAVALAFSTSVAALSFVLGVLTYIAPMEAPPPSRRAWPFVLPAALLALVAGFSGEFNWVHALALLVLGGAVYSAWREAAARGDAEQVPQAVAVGTDAEEQRPRWLAPVELVLALALAVVGGWAAVTLAERAAASVPLVSTRLVAVAVLTPLLALPMLTAVPPDRAAAHTASMASSVVALVLLNLCVLLPVLTIAWHVRGGLAGWATQQASTSPLVSAAAARATPMPFPLATWRVDAVVLTVLGFAMIPVALGRWELRRWEAIGLVAGYALYLAVSAAVSVRT